MQMPKPGRRGRSKAGKIVSRSEHVMASKTREADGRADGRRRTAGGGRRRRAAGGGRRATRRPTRHSRTCERPARTSRGRRARPARRSYVFCASSSVRRALQGTTAEQPTLRPCRAFLAARRLLCSKTLRLLQGAFRDSICYVQNPDNSTNVTLVWVPGHVVHGRWGAMRTLREDVEHVRQQVRTSFARRRGGRDARDVARRWPRPDDRSDHRPCAVAVRAPLL